MVYSLCFPKQMCGCLSLCLCVCLVSVSDALMSWGSAAPGGTVQPEG